MAGLLEEIIHTSARVRGGPMGAAITRGAEGDVRVFRLTDGEINDVRAAVAHARVALRLAAQEGQESVTCGYGVLDEVASGAYTPSKQLALLCGEVAEQYADMGFGATVLANVNVGEHDNEPDGPRIGQLVGVRLSWVKPTREQA